jgi:Putative zinc-finger
MNASFDQHLSTEVWEKYAMGMLSEEDCTPLEEHLLLCPACQDLLAQADEYIRIAKAATLSAGARRRWSKPAASAVTLVSMTDP